jgi:ABC-type dipeptide/oligopeptide/nickel transport system permease component
MAAYALGRVTWAFAQICVVLVLVFVLVRLLPGNPAESLALLSGVGGSHAQVAAVEARYHLNQSIPVQFWYFLVGIAHLNLGESFLYRQPVTTLIWQVLPNTLVLAFGALVVGLPIGVALGALAARRRGGITDSAIILLATLLLAIPYYFLGLFLLYQFSFHWRLLPGAGDQGVRSFVLPCATLALVVVGVTGRISRSSFAEASGAEHVRAARAKGMTSSSVWRRHVMRNGLISVATVGGILFGQLMGGAVFAEVVFERPGIGRLATTAITQHDFPLVEGIVLTIAVMFILINLGVDLLYAYLDPKFRDALQAEMA